MIKFRNITKHYPPDTYALKDVSLNIKSGEFVSIIGRSGTGKTTLIKLLTAEEVPNKGEVIVSGWNITNIDNRDIPFLRRQIGVIYQDFKLLPKKNIFENIAFALQVCGVSHKKIRQVVPQILTVVGLQGRETRYPYQLSGGEQQRVAIARALIHRPKILLADEPTGNLDTLNTKEILDLLLKINELGTTVLLVSHDKDLVNLLKKRVVTIEDGKIINDQRVGKYLI